MFGFRITSEERHFEKKPQMRAFVGMTGGDVRGGGKAKVANSGVLGYEAVRARAGKMDCFVASLLAMTELMGQRLRRLALLPLRLGFQPKHLRQSVQPAQYGFAGEDAVGFG